MVDDTAWWFFFILCCVVVLRSIAPLSIAYTSFLVLYRPTSFRLPWPLEYWAYAESLFYGLFWLYRHRYLQNPAVHPEVLPIDQRRELVERCLLNIPDYEQYFSNWFLGASMAEIKRDNLKDFFRWAYFNTDVSDASHDDELDEYVLMFEEKIGKKFEPGRSAVKCQRLSIDNAAILHRSLWWYVCVGVVDALTWTYMIYHKFHYYHPSLVHAFSRLPFRPWTIVVARQAPVRNLAYWHRPHTATGKLPILFLHGVGVGLYPYLNFLGEMNQYGAVREGDIGILAVEMPHISSTMGPAALDKARFCKQLLSILKHHNYNSFVLVSHSFGTFVSTQLLRDSQIAERIDSVVMVDPVSILLHLPDVANNFMIRKPKTANQWQLWYFGSKDAGIAHTLSRRFFWSENILWKEDLEHYPVTIFLSERDLLVNTAHIENYLLSSSDPTTNMSSLDTKHSAIVRRKRFDVIRLPNLDHGQLFDSKKWRAKLISEVHGHCLGRGVAAL